MDNFIYYISSEEDGKTILSFIRQKIKLSHNLLSKLKNNDGIKLNDENVTVRKILHAGDILKIIFPEEKSETILEKNIDLDVIYEDDSMIVVNKPSGMQVHPSHSDFENTLGNAIMFRYRDHKTVFRPITRLDKNTSGIVIIARTQFAAAELSRQIKEGIMHKKYMAVTIGIPNPLEGVIDAPIAREKEGIIKRCVRKDGKRAITKYNVIKTQKNKALVSVDLLTGRTHQIRVHMAYIGCPLYNDFLYGEQTDPGSYMLHCCNISLYHPITGVKMEFKSNPWFDI